LKTVPLNLTTQNWQPVTGNLATHISLRKDDHLKILYYFVYYLRTLILMKKAFLIILTLGCLSCGKPDQSSEQTAGDLKTVISGFEDELQTSLSNDKIDGSIAAAIVKENKVIWSKAFGYADLERKILADSSTIYRIGSVTKSFTAQLMMILVDEGKINLDDPVELYFPEVKKLKGYSASTKITFAQLASHTSGLAREPNLDDFDKGPIEKWEAKLLECLPATSFENVPGTKFSYCNIGYAILGAALSRAAGKPFIELVHEKIFVPLKMERSFFVVPDEFKNNLALGMSGGPPETVDLEKPREEHKGRGYKVPNGGIYSTPNDLARFMLSNMGYAPVLQNESLQLMQTARGPVASDYGLGFIIVKSDSINLVAHSGAVPGYTAFFGFDKNSKYGLVLMRNYNTGSLDPYTAGLALLSKLARARED
jgi:CubicO group peptidase (beta-lactamase class C family)